MHSNYCETNSKYLCAIFLSYLYSTELQEAASGGVARKEVFLKVSQNSQESICTIVSFLIKLGA